MKARLQRLFWTVYGRFAWDSVNQKFKQKLASHIVDLLTAKQCRSGETVLDAGCGTGNYSLALASHGFKVAGIDYSYGMLHSARGKVTAATAGNVTFRQMDMNRTLAFQDCSFDHVISMSTLWAVSDPLFTLSEFARVLKPGGTLLVLQVEKPAQGASLIKNRFRHLSDKTIGKIALVALKVGLERTSLTKYWTPLELLSLLLTSKKFAVSTVDHGPPIIITSAKIEN